MDWTDKSEWRQNGHGLGGFVLETLSWSSHILKGRTPKQRSFLSHTRLIYLNSVISSREPTTCHGWLWLDGSLWQRKQWHPEILCLELGGVPDLALPHTSCVTLSKLLHLSEPPFLVCNMVVSIVHSSRWMRTTELLSLTYTVIGFTALRGQQSPQISPNHLEIIPSSVNKVRRQWTLWWRGGRSAAPSLTGW